ncbi:MAG: prevent-host-death protein [Verrucomicrobia bacterium]|nr:prevent-host-death protein [Verrucomicrobiota bacterium]
MKTATTADLRNHFRRVSGWLDNGETVEVIRRGKPYARLSPWVVSTPQTVTIDFAAQRREIWGRRKFSVTEVAAMRAAELEGDES